MRFYCPVFIIVDWPIICWFYRANPATAAKSSSSIPSKMANTSSRILSGGWSRRRPRTSFRGCSSRMHARGYQRIWCWPTHGSSVVDRRGCLLLRKTFEGKEQHQDTFLTSNLHSCMWLLVFGAWQYRFPSFFKYLTANYEKANKKTNTRLKLKDRFS